VEGIRVKREVMIIRTWVEQKEIRQVMVFLQSHDVSPGFATKIFKQYGNEAINVAQKNPYHLALYVFGMALLPIN
jgi:exodeoxyribonuclease V alpha subunit